MAVLRRLAATLVAFTFAVTGLAPAPTSAESRQGPRLQTPAHQVVVNHPDFTWSRIAGATVYQLQVAQDSQFANIYKSIETPATRFIDTQTWPAASYWWRVRAVQPFRSPWSEKRVVTRRWLVPDAGNGRLEVARPDNLTTEDFSSDPGLQAPLNAIKISWEPVAAASYYVLQFDELEHFDLDRLFEFQSDFSCTTPHTSLTPNSTPATLPEQGIKLISDAGGLYECPMTQGYYWMRVRAVDKAEGERELFSLWSDESRSQEEPAPGPVLVQVTAPLGGTDALTPASLTAPADDEVFLDSPVLEWSPIAWADHYKVVIAVDRDFTTEVGHFSTTNTRLIPVERIPEDNAERSYYWYVVPCNAEDFCLSANRVVNRAGTYRSFKKLSPQPEGLAESTTQRVWPLFSWTGYSGTVTRLNSQAGQPHASVGGADGYQFQVRTKGAAWPEDTLFTDVPEFLPVGLRFGLRYKWRVRVVDGSGQARPWSKARWMSTPSAVAGTPAPLRATRTKTRVALNWQPPRTPYFAVTGYRLYFSFDGRRWRPLGDPVTKTRATYKIGKRDRYWFMVTALNYAGESRPSKVYVPR